MALMEAADRRPARDFLALADQDDLGVEGLRVFKSLLAVDGVITRPGLGTPLSEAIEALSGIGLPADHLDLLKQTNGAEGFGGYVRLFGFGPSSAIDLLQWNAENYWKFAWCGRATPFFCFAETGWGDQFAYRIDELRTGDTSIYCIDALAMQSEKIAADFTEFFTDEFLRICTTPYDEMMVAARLRPRSLRIGRRSPKKLGIRDARSAARMSRLPLAWHCRIAISALISNF